MNRNGASVSPCSTPVVISKKGTHMCVCHHQVILTHS